MVLISADTLRLVHRRVDVAPLGAPTLRGINRPVELFRVLSVHSEDDELKDDEVIGRNIERARSIERGQWPSRAAVTSWSPVKRASGSRTSFATRSGW